MAEVCPTCGQEIRAEHDHAAGDTPTLGVWHYYSTTEAVTVDNRGAGFGKLYVHSRSPRSQGQPEAILLWGPRGRITEANGLATTDEQRGRAIRALAETVAGRESLQLSEPFPQEVAS